MKVVINRCYGGFSLSRKANEMYAKAKGLNVGKWNDQWGFFEDGDFYDREIERHDPDLVRIVQELGTEASGRCASLDIVEIPIGVDYQIEEYDGNEWVAEKHRTWG